MKRNSKNPHPNFPTKVVGSPDITEDVFPSQVDAKSSTQHEHVELRTTYGSGSKRANTTSRGKYPISTKTREHREKLIAEETERIKHEKNAQKAPIEADVMIHEGPSIEEDDDQPTESTPVSSKSQTDHREPNGHIDPDIFQQLDDQDFLSAFSVTTDTGRKNIILDYWRQVANTEELSSKEVLSGGSIHVHPTTSHRSTFTRSQIEKYIKLVTQNRELAKKEEIQAEVRYILRHFRQRRCKSYCQRQYRFKEKFANALAVHAVYVKGAEIEVCHCGLTKRYHSQDAIDNSSTTWDREDNTEAVQPWNFGNLDITGHYSYLDLPKGTRKFLRLDDTRSSAGSYLYNLLTRHWGLRTPNIVISITGGDILPLLSNKKLHEAFRDGIIKTAVNTKAWIITEGLYNGSSRELGDIFQQDLKRSEWSEEESHAEIPLIAIAPWGVVASHNDLMGIYVGTAEAKYNFNAINNSEDVSANNALDPYHTAYILADDGTHGFYAREPEVRSALERHVKEATAIDITGNTNVSTPVIIIVVGGDRFTLKKLALATSEEKSTPVVIVNGSGAIANMLAETYYALMNRHDRNKGPKTELSIQEEATLSVVAEEFKAEGLLSGQDDFRHLKQIMINIHLITVFGVAESDEENLDKAILSATFGSVTDISSQLSLTLAMDRVDVARDKIFVEARKEELGSKGMIEDSLFTALQESKSKFVQLLIDQDLSAELNFNDFLTMRVLHSLYRKTLDPHGVLGCALVSLTKKDVYGNDELEDDNLLPQVGRILHNLMGNHYRLLYQERRFREDFYTDWPVPRANDDGWTLCFDPQEEAVWHLFLWAVMSNKTYIAEHFLFETGCKIGAALVACKMLRGIAEVAEVWQETELVYQLQENAEYFESIALRTIDNMYEMNRDDAYACLVSVLPFHLGGDITPLTIADDAKCMRFMGHACTQSLLNLIWMHYMDLDTAWWKVLPIYFFCPVVLPFITFDAENLEFGTFAPKKVDDSVPELAKQENTEHGPSEADLSSVPSDFAKPGETHGRKRKRIKYTLWSLKCYYTAPIMKYGHGLVVYLAFLGIFSHVVLSKLKPIQSTNEISIYEWMVYVWVGSIIFQEIDQLVSRKSSGPLHHLNWHKECARDWANTWHVHERVSFVLRLHRVQLWLSDRWNKIDAVMILLFTVSVTLRLTLNELHFGIVRFFFSVTLIFFYMRLLRLGYVFKQLGPRIITIQAMVSDLLQFFTIMCLFLVSFGIAFQAILSPNEQPSWNLLVDVLWRPYWQMFGELLIDDQGMGRDVDGKRCYTNRTLAQIENGELCYDWLATILLAVFMLITNIMLLNLLIAIFSNSFENIEAESKLIWRYHMYDMVHEYYESPWLPPPFNMLCLVVSVLLWLQRWPRRLAFLCAKRRYRHKVHGEKAKSGGILAETEYSRLQKDINIEAEEYLQNDCLNKTGFYYTDQKIDQLYISHFRQEEFMRNEDMEEKAYKRYTRNKIQKREKDHKVKSLLKLNSTRLQSITSELSDVKQKTSELHRDIRSTDSPYLKSIPSSDSPDQHPLMHRHTIGHLPKQADELRSLKLQMITVTQKVDHLQDSFANHIETLTPILDYVRLQAKKKTKKKKEPELGEDAPSQSNA